MRRTRGRRQERAEGPAIVVAIAGRPNAGKSTLFNRLFGRRLAIVDDMPGVTRDANRATLAYDGRNWEFVDTGGIEEQALGQGLAERVQERSLATLKRADAILHLVDGQAGLSAADRAVSVRIRQLGVPTLLVVNKIDRVEQSQRTLDFVELGEGDAVALSSAHGLGVGELWEALEALLERNGRLPERLPEPEESDVDGTGEDLGRIDGPLEESGAAADDRATRPPRIALVGRPNVGKSSLLNRLAGFERSLVDSIPGTTRDPIDVEIVRGERRYVVVDTAGLRRPSRIHETIEGYAASASVRARSTIPPFSWSSGTCIRVPAAACSLARISSSKVNSWRGAPKSTRIRPVTLIGTRRFFPSWMCEPSSTAISSGVSFSQSITAWRAKAGTTWPR